MLQIALYNGNNVSFNKGRCINYANAAAGDVGAFIRKRCDLFGYRLFLAERVFFKYTYKYSAGDLLRSRHNFSPS